MVRSCLARCGWLEIATRCLVPPTPKLKNSSLKRSLVTLLYDERDTQRKAFWLVLSSHVKMSTKSSKGRRPTSADVAEVKNKRWKLVFNHGIGAEEDECKQEDLGKI
jgi:hypothetical protein